MQCKYQRQQSSVPPICPPPLWEVALLSVPTQGHTDVPWRFQHFKLKKTFPQHNWFCSATHAHNSVLQHRHIWNKYTSPELLCATPLVLGVQEWDPSVLFIATHASIKRTESHSSRDNAGKTLWKQQVHKRTLADTSHPQGKGLRSPILPCPGEHTDSTPAPSLSC